MYTFNKNIYKCHLKVKQKNKIKHRLLNLINAFCYKGRYQNAQINVLLFKNASAKAFTNGIVII